MGKTTPERTSRYKKHADPSKVKSSTEKRPREPEAVENQRRQRKKPITLFHESEQEGEKEPGSSPEVTIEAADLDGIHPIEEDSRDTVKYSTPKKPYASPRKRTKIGGEEAICTPRRAPKGATPKEDIDNFQIFEKAAAKALIRDDLQMTDDEKNGDSEKGKDDVGDELGGNRMSSSEDPRLEQRGEAPVLTLSGLPLN